jgi:nucleotide-binding universal stress UspA family protein
MRLSEGTVLSHVKRKSISQRIRDAKAVVPVEQSDAITPLQSVALTMQQRGQRYAERLGGVVERVVPHLESMEPGEILDTARNLEQFDRVARRTYGLDDRPPGTGSLNLAILTGQAAIQVIAPG